MEKMVMSTTGHYSERRERNPKNQQKDVASRCFLEEIPQYKECAIRKRLASTSQEEKHRSCCFKFQGFSAQAAISTSRIHPCLSNLLRLSPSVSLSLSLFLSLTLPPCFLSLFIVFLTDLQSSLSIFFLPLHILSHALKPCKELSLSNHLCPTTGLLKPLKQTAATGKDN